MLTFEKYKDQRDFIIRNGYSMTPKALAELYGNEAGEIIYGLQAELDHLKTINAELLEALKAILPWHDSHPAEMTDNPIILKCRAAIAKATQGVEA
jgi:hypothetical protein